MSLVSTSSSRDTIPLLSSSSTNIKATTTSSIDTSVSATASLAREETARTGDDDDDPRLTKLESLRQVDPNPPPDVKVFLKRWIVLILFCAITATNGFLWISYSGQSPRSLFFFGDSLLTAVTSLICEQFFETNANWINMVRRVSFLSLKQRSHKTSTALARVHDCLHSGSCDLRRRHGALWSSHDGADRRRAQFYRRRCARYRLTAVAVLGHARRSNNLRVWSMLRSFDSRQRLAMLFCC